MCCRFFQSAGYVCWYSFCKYFTYPPVKSYWRDAASADSSIQWQHGSAGHCIDNKSTTVKVVLFATQACKPGSVLTAIYLAPQSLTGSSRLLGTAGPALCPSTALLRDRVYSVKPMLPWAGQAMNLPFHLSCFHSSISLLHLS